MHKTIFLLLWSGRLATGLSAQKSAPVWAVDFVRIKAGHRAETLFFYENNWKFYRLHGPGPGADQRLPPAGDDPRFARQF